MAGGAQVGRVEQGDIPCQKVNFEKLFSGASNLPGVFSLLLGNNLVEVRIWGEGLVMDPAFGREKCDLQSGNNR